MQQTLNRYDADGSGELSDDEMCALLGYVLYLDKTSNYSTSLYF